MTVITDRAEQLTARRTDEDLTTPAGLHARSTDPLAAAHRPAGAPARPAGRDQDVT